MSVIGCFLLAYALSLRDLEEMMAERGMIIDYFTLHRLIPLLNKAFRWHKWNAAAALRFFECHISIHGTDYSR
ncbi:hypothetical protein [Yersinia aldovae]|uniref:hypothetical protein n=1 Tax=Yersinia aldovae TaxID=29483 RepID=UPI0021BD1650|nr:hypothetical protein [Yersinia aldovae]